MGDHLLILLVGIKEVDATTHELRHDGRRDDRHAVKFTIARKLVKLGFLGVALCQGLGKHRPHVLFIDAGDLAILDNVALLHADSS